ncbi:AI-2E family transporter [Nocardioides sp. GY 10127]|uniref:AI-2E family transporter n=1 Tax=Nocardioides sp. GY 10127 TaxID=2569762 RepID=UPI0010A7C01F|nr:AI-2E family transporter [Nocardioides sp. GY 10127]TIC84040.1 AI-2E family transporter [Nocardioides sp. GY 10127]
MTQDPDAASTDPLVEVGTLLEEPEDSPGDQPGARSGDGSGDGSDDASGPPGSGDVPELGVPGPPLRRGPFLIGFFGALGAFAAWWLAGLVVSLGSTLVLLVVAMFLAAGLNPAVELLERRGLRRGLAVLLVIVAVLAAFAAFVFALVPVITDQVTAIGQNVPGWIDQLESNQQIRDLNDEYDILTKVQDFVTGGSFLSSIFGGVLGVGIAIVGALANVFFVVVLTLYFLASMKATKQALYQLAPASRRDRVSRLGDRVLASVGGYVAGAFVVALCAGLSSLIFFFVVGLSDYAVALAFVVALLDVIPMVGATLGAVVVTLIGFAVDPSIGIACLIFYLVYQQVENYFIYPRVMSRSVDVPGVVTVIAALVGGALLGVVGALLAIPTASALLMLTREVLLPRQDAR